jgi:transposase
MNSAAIDPVVYIGVDVSAQWLDLAGMARLKRQPNSPSGHAKFITHLPRNAHVIVEASGGYEQALWLALLRADIKVSRVNPARVRYFAKANQQLAKTDPLDAALLVRFGQDQAPAPDILPSDQMLQLQKLVSRREQLVAVRAQQQVQYQQLSCPSLQAQARALMKCLHQQIKSLEQSMRKTLASQPFAPKAKRLEELPGVSSVTSATLLALLPELGQHSDRRLCSLAGLAPYAYDSGPLKGQRHIQGGRWRVRRVLYMAAVTSLTHNPILKAFYQRLRQRGKPAKVALTALMRKILCLLNKMISHPQFTLAS